MGYIELIMKIVILNVNLITNLEKNMEFQNILEKMEHSIMNQILYMI